MKHSQICRMTALNRTLLIISLNLKKLEINLSLCLNQILQNPKESLTFKW